MTNPHVIIAGGGIGGLCLAHGLRAAGVSVAVYERDPGSTRTREGFRLHINPAGSRALHACLPDRLWRAFLAAAGPAGGFSFLTEQLAELVTVEESVMYPAACGPQEDHHAIDRATLRTILLTGLDDVVEFDAEVIGYEPAGGRVAAVLADGRRADADVLVGAEGVGSRVRRQLLPEAELRDTGVVSIAHRIPLTPATLLRTPLRTGMASVTVDAPYALFTSAFVPADPAAAQPYVLAALIGDRTAYPADVTELDDAGLRCVVDGLVARWHPDLRAALKQATERYAHPFTASPAVPTWEPRPVTVLGDAIHAMPPTGGLGANTALRDAHLLTRHLAAYARDSYDLHTAIGDYQTEMRAYASEAIARARAMQDQIVAHGPVRTAAARSWMRLCRAVPALRRRTFADTFAAPAQPRTWEQNPAERPERSIA